MSTEIQKHENGTGTRSAIIERVLLVGDLKLLSPDERSAYYLRVCESCGLNPLTKPFEYILLNGKLTLYATKNCTDQLRALHSVSVQIVGREVQGDLYVVTARASVDGRQDEDVGAVVLPRSGEARANAAMKAHTKAKRRVTLSICGLSLLDESEVEAVPGARRVQVDEAGEVQPAALAPAAPDSDALLSDFYEALASAQDDSAIALIGVGANAARKAGELTADDVRQLADAAKARRADLKKKPMREPGDEDEVAS